MTETSCRRAIMLAVCLALGVVLPACDRGSEGVLHTHEETDPWVVTEEPTELEGTAEIHGADGLDGTATQLLYLRTADEELIRLLGVPNRGILPGSRVRVEGQWVAEGDVRRFAVRSWVLQAPTPLPTLAPPPTRRIAVLLVHFEDPGPDGTTTSSMREQVFDGARSIAAYYREVSYGREELTGDVFGWYPLDVATDECDYNTWGTAARAAFVADGHDLADYDHFMYYFPNMPVCAWAGLGAMGNRENPARDSWYNGFSQCVIQVQEVGHNFGMVHSRTLTCTSGNETVPLSSDCTEKEYGNPICPLGFGPCGHLMAYQKAYMGYFEPCNVVTAHGGGVYRLVNLEQRCDGIQALRVPRVDGTYYILEYRTPLGFDGPGTTAAGSDDDWPAGLSGVLFQIAGEHQTVSGGIGRLLDMTPGSRSPGAGNSSQDHLDGFLMMGETYVDPDGLATFTVLSQDPMHAVVEIDLPGATGVPICDDGSNVEADDEGRFGALECDGAALMVTIASPVDGAVFSAGEDIPVLAEVTADDVVSFVDLFVDGTLVESDPAMPYEWIVTGLAAGTHRLAAVAHDPNQEAMSPPVEVIVEGAGDSGGGEEGDSGGDGSGGDSEGGGDGGTTSTTTQGPPATTSTTGTGGFPSSQGFDPSPEEQGCACRQTNGLPKTEWPWMAWIAWLPLFRTRRCAAGSGTVAATGCRSARKRPYPSRGLWDPGTLT